MIKKKLTMLGLAGLLALAIFESSRFEKIRYAKALSVETTWLFCDSDQLDQCMARVYYRCVFDDAVLRVPGWLKAFCDQRTREELRALREQTPATREPTRCLVAELSLPPAPPGVGTSARASPRKPDFC